MQDRLYVLFLSPLYDPIYVWLSLCLCILVYVDYDLIMIVVSGDCRGIVCVGVDIVLVRVIVSLFVVYYSLWCCQL